MQNHDEFDGYNVYEDELVNELLSNMSVSNIRSLHAKLKKLGFHDWLGWFSTHLKEIEIYAQASPKQRDNQKHAEADAALLMYGALQMLQLSGRMAHYFDNPCLLSDNSNSRNVRAARGKMLWQANFLPWSPWLFDEPAELGSPFANDEES